MTQKQLLESLNAKPCYICEKLTPLLHPRLHAMSLCSNCIQIPDSSVTREVITLPSYGESCHRTDGGTCPRDNPCIVHNCEVGVCWCR